MRRLGLLCIVLVSIMLVACAGPLARDKDDKIKEFNRIEQDDAEISGSPADLADSPRVGQYSILNTNVNLYFLDESLGQLVPEVRRFNADWSNMELVDFALKQLIKGPETSGLSPVISKDVKINKIEFEENILSVDLSSEFYESDDLALARAAITNSLLDLGNFKYIRLTIDGREASDSLGANAGLTGLLTRYPVSINEISALEAQNFSNADVRKIKWELFFQDYSGYYLLSEVRTINVRNNNYAEAIVNELIKGPSAEGEGYYPTIPKGTVLNKTEFIKGKDDKSGIALYFSKEFRNLDASGPSQETSMLSSLVYSLTSLPQVDFIKIYYENSEGEYIEDPIYNTSLEKELTVDHFPNRIGRRVRVYFGDTQSMLLHPEYRAIAYDENNLAARILAELATDPVNPESERVIPAYIQPGDISVKVEEQLAEVDIPSACFDAIDIDNKRIIRDLYAVVNTLTDPVNMCNIREVQFTIDGSVVESYKDISLKEPFVMNPALIKTE
ncbi:MAG TPA: GerMN domain-containing protein [Clostridiales bacterium]|nr:GerMN domain-containing protein [Clostridiales bacterium]